MSQIEKLSIRGIRSFSPDDTNVIEFYTPLTLIVGNNGSGKTTIIECLKYATTGDMPPCSKGGAFIHDPKIANEQEVKAQIKLKFRSMNGNEMVCIRSMQLTQKRAKREQKTLEGLIITKDPLTGEQSSLSAKCAELDTEIPNYLGVSRAVLENVIFCHQEESNWPLSEPSVLKKKFDDIFSATRYTKALDEIRSIRKQQAVEIKFDTQELDHLRFNKDKAQKVSQNLEGVTEQIASFTNNIKRLDEELVHSIEEAENLRLLHDQMQLQLTRLDSLCRERIMLANQKKELESAITLMPESEEELANLFNKHEMEVSTIQNRLMELECEKSEISALVSQLQTKCTQKAIERGRYQADHESYLRLVENRDKLMTELTQHFGLSLANMDPAEFLRLFQKYIKSCEEKYSEVKDQTRKSERQLQENVNQLNLEMSTKRQMMQLKESSKIENQRKIDEINANLSKIYREKTEFETFKDSLVTKEKAFNEAKAKLASVESDSKMKQLEKKRIVLEDERTELTEALTTAHAQAGTIAKLASKKEDITLKKRTVDRMIENDRANFMKYLNTVPAVSELDSILRQTISAKEKMTQEVDNKNTEANLDLKRIQMELRKNDEALSSKQKQLAEKKSEINFEIGNDNLDARIKENAIMLDESKKKVALAENGETLYKEFSSEAEAQNHCPLCERTFDDSQVLQKLLQKIENIIASFPLQAKQFEAVFTQLLNERAKLERLKPSWSLVERVEEEIALISQQSSQLKSQYDEALKNSKATSAELSQSKSDLQSLASLMQRSNEILHVMRDVSSLEADIHELQEELSSAQAISSVEEIQIELDRVDSEMKDVRRQIDRQLNELQSRRRECQVKENQYRDAREQLLTIESRFQSVQRAQDDLDSLVEQNNAIATDIQALELDIQQISSGESLVNQELLTLRECNRLLEEKALTDFNQAKQSLNNYQSINSEAERYEKEGCYQRVASATRDMEELESRVHTNKGLIDDINNQIDRVKSNLSNINELERNVKDNYRLHRLSREITEKEGYIVALRQEVGEYDSQIYKSKIIEHQRKKEELSTKKARLQGEMTQLVSQKRSLQQEMQSDYRDIEKRFTEQVIKLRTTELAYADLEKYAKALDNAIMKFHSLKMEEINKIVRELWVNTYRGTDIDGIEIRSDTETLKGNRSYNYRVVMLQNDTELDMRGRCSAGQKVLACLIIRLALAETFGINCGILALDEPTTNLDVENIQSLAQSLRDVVQVRGRQKNFQLIVITHDETFIDELGRCSGSEFYVCSSMCVCG